MVNLSSRFSMETGLRSIKHGKDEGGRGRRGGLTCWYLEPGSLNALSVACSKLVGGSAVGRETERENHVKQRLLVRVSTACTPKEGRRVQHLGQ